MVGVARAAWWVAVVSVLVGPGTVLGFGADAGEPPPCSSPGQVVHVPGQGPGCRYENGWLLRTPLGRPAFTHGPDPFEEDGEAQVEPASHSAPPVCVSNPLTEPHHVLVYARAADAPSGYASMVPVLRGAVAQANGRLQDDAEPFGAAVNYRFRCGADGKVEVVHAVLATDWREANYVNVVVDMVRAGHASPFAKYWVWYHGLASDCPACAGQAMQSAFNDEADVDSMNNVGPNYGVVWGRTGSNLWRLMAHESGHTMGAVWDEAPHSSRAGHCHDGLDVMCYRDGGSRQCTTGGFDCANTCLDLFHFDCGNDDYFSPDPAEGTYLFSNWNIGSPINRFLDHGPGACVFVRRDVLAAPAFLVPGVEGVNQRTEAVPASCEGRRFVLRANVGAAGLVPPMGLAHDFDVCWKTEAGVVLRCSEEFGEEEGVVPVGARLATVRLAFGAPGGYALFVT